MKGRLRSYNFEDRAKANLRNAEVSHIFRLKLAVYCGFGRAGNIAFRMSIGDTRSAGAEQPSVLDLSPSPEN